MTKVKIRLVASNSGHELSLLNNKPGLCLHKSQCSAVVFTHTFTAFDKQACKIEKNSTLLIVLLKLGLHLGFSIEPAPINSPLILSLRIPFELSYC